MSKCHNKYLNATIFIYHVSITAQAINALLARQQRFKTVESGTGVAEISKALVMKDYMCLIFIKDC